MADFSNCCFVCHQEIDLQKATINPQINLPVCDQCCGTEKEKLAVDDLTDSLAEGFVCGCI